MKNNNKIILVSGIIMSLTAIVLTSNYIFNNKDKTITIENKINNYLVSTSTSSTENLKTVYADGRPSAVRKINYYNYVVETAKPFGDTAAAKLGLITVITEWNKYDANVASPQGGFIEEEIFPNEERKKEFRLAGTQEVDMNSQMVGGDEESNRRFKEPSIRYWIVASKMFEQEFKNMKKAEGISNRDVDSVTFDFLTTSGFYTVQLQKADLESGKSVWSNMFKESKFLNAEMKRVQDESQKDYEKRVGARSIKER